ncbi:MAG: anthranilate phosphoribosyltransferase [Acidimicrobiia bacterium]|nr:anthranilate phosphoribosyltransferase [Acidimicrobiia bacterium]
MGAVSWPEVFDQLLGSSHLSQVEARSAMDEIMAGEATDAQIAAFLAILRTKGETAAEMTGFVEAMRSAALTVEIDAPIVDLVGTGGDRSGTFNISTTAAFVAAGAGVKIAKHGNRAASSAAGSADLLEALGIDLAMSPERTVQMVKEVGFGFFFAPQYHPAMRHAGPVRRQLGFRTVFNFLGPLCNPAGARRYALGVSDPRMAELMIQVLTNLGAETAFVFYGEDGLDELTTTGPSFIYRLRHGEITHAEFTPEDFGVTRARMEDLQGGDVSANIAITLQILDGAAGPKRDIALVNAAPAIVAAGLADGFVEAMEIAAQSVDSGRAGEVLEAAVTFSGGSEKNV